jgi:quinol monooxygenase YgiN
MVVRIFRATPKQALLREYETFVTEVAMPTVRQAKGCLEAKALKSLGVVREILFITVWDNLESVKIFMGKTWNQVYFIDDEAEMVEEGTTEVKHYHQIASF